jgi:hypothetical protein
MHREVGFALLIGGNTVARERGLHGIVGSKGYGKRFRTDWSASSDWPEPNPNSRHKPYLSATSACITADSLSLRSTLSLPGKKSAPFRSTLPCGSRIGARWRKTIRLLSRVRSFRSRNNLCSIPTPIKESMCMCCWTARSSFSIKMKKSPPSTPKQRTHLAYIERTASRRGSGYGPISI